MKYEVVIERGETSVGAWIPDFPGCVAVGETVDEVRRLISEALAMHLEDMAESGISARTPSSLVEYVDVGS